MSVSIKVKDISKYYDKTIGLKNVNIEIKQGELVCLLGPSGCGKSTLLRIIAGLDTPTKGHIYINDKDVTTLPPAKRNYGIMFQSYALFPNLTAYENVIYALRNKKYNEKVITERADWLFQMIHLKDAKNKYSSQLSGGEQQRIALARALATEPDFLLLDEPLSALDAKVRLSLRQQICAIQKELKLTTIMVTHDQDEALTMADRIIVMDKATVMQIGTPEEVYINPQNPFVADFIGSINFVDMSITNTRKRSESELFAVRPEKIELFLEKTENSFMAEVIAVEFRGVFYRITVEMDYQIKNEKLMVDVPFQRVKELGLKQGSRVFVRIAPDEMLYFDIGVKKAI